jgi:hypothetical protein
VRGDGVVVTLNYRLGALGFLLAPQLGASGNQALLDQVAVLRWVRAQRSDERRFWDGRPWSEGASAPPALSLAPGRRARRGRPDPR